MGEIVYSVTMSLDGHLTGPRAEADWIAMDPGRTKLGARPRKGQAGRLCRRPQLIQTFAFRVGDVPKLVSRRFGAEHGMN